MIFGGLPRIVGSGPALSNYAAARAATSALTVEAFDAADAPIALGPGSQNLRTLDPSEHYRQSGAARITCRVTFGAEMEVAHAALGPLVGVPPDALARLTLERGGVDVFTLERPASLLAPTFGDLEFGQPWRALAVYRPDYAGFVLLGDGETEHAVADGDLVVVPSHELFQVQADAARLELEGLDPAFDVRAAYLSVGWAEQVDSNLAVDSVLEAPEAQAGLRRIGFDFGKLDGLAALRFADLAVAVRSGQLLDPFWVELTPAPGAPSVSDVGRAAYHGLYVLENPQSLRMLDRFLGNFSTSFDLVDWAPRPPAPSN